MPIGNVEVSDVVEEANGRDDVEENKLESETFGLAYGRLVMDDRGDLPSALRVLGNMRGESFSCCCGDEERWSSGVEVMGCCGCPPWL